MLIEEHKITVGQITENYQNDAEEGVSGYNGKLNIRPPYQREFVYKNEQRDEDEDVTKKSDIYEYLLTGDERKLSIRAFDRRDALAAYEKQNHKCAGCHKEFEFEKMHADHIIPWSQGGKTAPENCQMLCVACNLKKSDG